RQGIMLAVELAVAGIVVLRQGILRRGAVELPVCSPLQNNIVVAVGREGQLGRHAAIGVAVITLFYFIFATVGINAIDAQAQQVVLDGARHVEVALINI